MTLAVILVVAAALALVLIFGVTVSRSLQISAGTSLAGRIQPIDVDAFRNLIDPAEDEYLRRRLPASEFRLVRRQRLRAMAMYVQMAGRNAAALVLMGLGADAQPRLHIDRPGFEQDLVSFGMRILGHPMGEFAAGESAGAEIPELR